MLKTGFRYFGGVGLLCLAVFLLQCASLSKMDNARPVPRETVRAGEHAVPPVEQQVAGEILAYMMQVVLGKAGDPRLRDAWYTRGFDTELDFELISRIMTDPQMDRKQILVLDNNILGLSNVLYYYNRRLNLFKGANSRQSLFPSVELLSMRMMLLQKIHRGEKVNMTQLIQQKAKLMDPGIDPKNIDAAEIGLNLSELKLLKSILVSEPFFMDYLENPFVVDTLHRVGAVSPDEGVSEKISQARYSACGCLKDRAHDGGKVLKIAILPSIIPAFEYRNVDLEAYPCGFKPTEAYAQASREIQAKIVDTVQRLLRSQMLSQDRLENSKAAVDYGARAEDLVQRHVEFIALDRRPFVIYPENAEQAINSLCPEAVFSIIVLGENVYLSLYLKESDIYPAVNRMYLDIMDIRHAQVDYELGQVSMFIFNQLKDRISVGS